MFSNSLKGMPLLILAAVLTTYVILGVLYESFIHPLTIISGLPAAGIGALITLIAFNMELTVIALIGMMMLIGIVKKNAIMMVTSHIERRREGCSPDAIREACVRRFRPIMMTTLLCALRRTADRARCRGRRELRQPLGIAVVGGLILSQLLTLFITPVVYLYLDRLDRKVYRQLAPPRRRRRLHPCVRFPRQSRQSKPNPSPLPPPNPSPACGGRVGWGRGRVGRGFIHSAFVPAGRHVLQ